MEVHSVFDSGLLGNRFRFQGAPAAITIPGMVLHRYGERSPMKAILFGYLLLVMVLSGCSAVTNYRRYDFFLDN